ncbi:MAG: thiamine pyrophosphate-dependent enzyme [Solirubrobacteraceae bacterium]
MALTGQSDLERMHKESHQYIDLIGIMRPVVKWNARVSSPEIVPEVVRYDLVEHAPEHWNPHSDKRIVMIDTVAAEIDEFFIAEVELIGDIPHVLARQAAGCERTPSALAGSERLRELILGALNEARHDNHFPMRPPRVLADLREALGPNDLLVSDVGLHKLWIGRMFPAHEPGTVLIANGLAGVGFALPSAIAAKLVDPHRHVVTVSGDGGIPAWRCANADDLSGRLAQALALDLPSLIVVPIDYSVDVAISRELGTETVAT